jgi:arylsulfatase A-like enzyme
MSLGPSRRGSLLAVLTLFALPGCGDSGDRDRVGIVLVLVDALRADHLGCYGYERPTSPRIDALAADGALFVNAATPAPWTLPAMATLFTSLYPSVHRATATSDLSGWIDDRDSFRPTSVLDESRNTLAESLQSAGFATAAFVNGPYPGRAFGFAQGFDRFDDSVRPGIRMNVEAALSWLDHERPERFFIYLHSTEVHSPYTEERLYPRFRRRSHPQYAEIGRILAEEASRQRSFDFDPGYGGSIDGSRRTLSALRRSRTPPPARDLEHLVALYDRGVRYVDHWIGALLVGLTARGLHDDVIVIITADHGEEFFEHGGLEHGATFYEEVMRVPLIVRTRDAKPGRVVEDQVGLIDVMPTILDLVGIAPAGPLQGRSFRPALLGASLPERALFGEASHVPGLSALRTNDRKYILRRGEILEELYDLEADPAEATNLCPSDPLQCRPFRARLERWAAEMRRVSAGLALPAPPAAAIDAETREQLRALGYEAP